VTVQARLARLFAAEFGLTLSPLPVELSEVTVSLLWHRSYDHDPAHAWLRDQLKRTRSRYSAAKPSFGEPKAR
jgi:DNA-binding transcriptional LysR family regulator